MRKILIIGSAIAAALLLGSGAFAGSDTRIVDAHQARRGIGLRAGCECLGSAVSGAEDRAG